ncbi:hypothetical protein CRYUN_Cryun10bG0020000 [Craigia yunnanensis]
MGCGESKHVATGNTVSRKNSRAGSKRGKISETIEETSKNDIKTSSIFVKEEGKNVSQESGGNNSRAVADRKDIAESTELKKEENENDKEKKSGVLKENEEPVEGIAFEGISGKSELTSPQEEAGKESLSNENVKVADALEDKKLAQETKIEAKNENVEDKTLTEEKKAETLQEIKFAEETKEDIVEDKKLVQDKKEETVKDQKLAEVKKEETAKGEPETVKEENLVKETETTETSEAKVSTPVEKKEKKSAVSPAAEDLKTE